MHQMSIIPNIIAMCSLFHEIQQGLQSESLGQPKEIFWWQKLSLLEVTERKSEVLIFYFS